MAELKTVPTRANVDRFLKGITDEKKRADCYQVLEIMKKAARSEPKMWGTSIVGFGKYHTSDPSGGKTDGFLTGFSPSKQRLTLYIMGEFNQFDDLMKKLGKYTTGRNCIHISTLEDVDMKILKKLISLSVKEILQLKTRAGKGR